VCRVFILFLFAQRHSDLAGRGASGRGHMINSQSKSSSETDKRHDVGSLGFE